MISVILQSLSVSKTNMFFDNFLKMHKSATTASIPAFPQLSSTTVTVTMNYTAMNDPSNATAIDNHMMTPSNTTTTQTAMMPMPPPPPLMTMTMTTIAMMMAKTTARTPQLSLPMVLPQTQNLVLPTHSTDITTPQPPANN